MVNSSWSPRKYQGALDGFGVLLKSANSRSGAFTTIENRVVKRVIAKADKNSLRLKGAARREPCQ